MEYHQIGYRKSDLVRLDIKINNEVSPIDEPIIPSERKGIDHAEGVSTSEDFPLPGGVHPPVGVWFLEARFHHRIAW